MSIRAYRLLRNNKEQGPFTAEELIRLHLKPYDLIWVDGRSAAWSYPGEMQEFKPYMAFPAEPGLDQSKQTIPAISPSVQAAIAVNDTIAQPAIKQKPRYKVSAAWSRIQTITMPVHSELMVAANQETFSGPQSKPLSWEEAWLDWEKEKTIIPVKETVKAGPSAISPSKTINENYNTTVPVIKYAEPLESLKDKYIENILYQKQRSRKSFSFGKTSEFVLPSVALLIIFSVGYWLLHGSNETAAALSTVPVKTIQPAKTENTNTTPVNTNDNATVNTASQNDDATQNIAPINETDKAEDRKKTYIHPAKSVLNQPDHIKQQSNPATQVVAHDTKSTTQKITNQPAKQFDSSVINSVPHDNAYNDASSSNTGDLNAANSRPVRRRVNAGESSSDQSTQKNINATPKNNNTRSGASYVSIPEYIEMNNGTANLKIENISDVDLDLVVVDVQYYDASSRFRKGETLYLHNLRAGKNIIVKTPKDINSQYATSKVSLVSSDANKVYVIGDN